jgi:flagellar hook-associated protein 1 FlgK
MPSLTQALSLALSGLQTSTGLIALSSNNIANAQTPGYTTKTASVTSVDNGSVLGGSTIASYSRATDKALTNNYNAATSQASYYSTQNSYMSQVQALLDSTAVNPTLSNDIAQFSSAWSQYSAAPESNIQQQNVINAGRTLANDISTIASQINGLDTQVQTDTSTTVNTLNSDLSQVAVLNSQIQTATGIGQPTGDLEDQRDKLVNQISSMVTVTVQTRSSGEIALYTPQGQILVDSGTPQVFSFNNGTVTDSAGTNVTATLIGGSIQAELQFRDTSASAAASTTPGVGIIAKLQSQMSKLVDAFTNSSGSTPSAFATAYTNAVTASTAVGGTQNGDPVASNFFTVSNVGGIPDPGTLRVNAALLNGTDVLPQTSTKAIADSFNATATYTASGLSVPNATYATLGSAILSNFQQAANTINSQSITTTSQQTFYQQTLSNKTGVNMDTELANLVNYQNSYAAAAHVITTVSQMMTTLMATLP